MSPSPTQTPRAPAGGVKPAIVDELLTPRYAASSVIPAISQAPTLLTTAPARGNTIGGLQISSPRSPRSPLWLGKSPRAQSSPSHSSWTSCSPQTSHSPLSTMFPSSLTKSPASFSWSTGSLASSPPNTQRRTSPARAGSLVLEAEAAGTLRAVESAVQAVHKAVEAGRRRRQACPMPCMRTACAAIADLAESLGAVAKQQCQQSQGPSQCGHQGGSGQMRLKSPVGSLELARISHKEQVGAIARSRSFTQSLLRKLDHLHKGATKCRQTVVRSTIGGKVQHYANGEAPGCAPSGKKEVVKTMHQILREPHRNNLPRTLDLGVLKVGRRTVFV